MRLICISNAGTHGHTHQFSQSDYSRSRSWPITQCPIARTWESAPKQWAVMAIVEGRSPTFETVLRRLIGCTDLLFKFGIKTKTHFEWLLWHWSSLGQLNLEPTRPNGLVGCKVPTDLVKISVKEATHSGFHYNIPQSACLWNCSVDCRIQTVGNWKGRVSPSSPRIKANVWKHLTSTNALQTEIFISCQSYKCWLLHVTARYEETRSNKVWWQCLVPTSTTRFASDVGYRMAKI